MVNNKAEYPFKTEDISNKGNYGESIATPMEQGTAVQYLGIWRLNKPQAMHHMGCIQL